MEYAGLSSCDLDEVQVLKVPCLHPDCEATMQYDGKQNFSSRVFCLNHRFSRLTTIYRTPQELAAVTAFITP